MKYVPKELPDDVADISAGRSGWKEWAKNAAFVLVFLLLVWVALGFVADTTAGAISDEQEAAWFRDFQVGERPDNDPAFQTAQAIFDKLLKQDGLRQLPYQLRLLKSPQPNAFAVPGGSVVVTTALLKSVESERSLAFVLGHELGHHQHRHALKRMGRSLIYRAALALTVGDSGAGYALDSSVKAGEASFSRGQERESDVFGMELVFKAYGRVDGTLQFFEQLLTWEGGKGTRLDPFASHPLTADRLKELKKLQATYATP